MQWNWTFPFDAGSLRHSDLQYTLSNLTEQVMTGYGQNGQNGTHGSKPRPRTGIAYEAEDLLLSES